MEKTALWNARQTQEPMKVKTRSVPFRGWPPGQHGLWHKLGVNE